MNTSDPSSFLAQDPFRKQLMLVMAPSEASFRILEKTLGRFPQGELRWHSETIDALADVFMAKPQILLVFGDSNQESLAFIRLVRNNSQFHDMPIFAIFPEPERFGQRLTRKGLSIQEVFSTPIDGPALYAKAAKILGVN
ncbi:MAG: hypothetical protein ACO1RX_17910 [Candidatus Sericytochromatia bacterium]